MQETRNRTLITVPKKSSPLAIKRAEARRRPAARLPGCPAARLPGCPAARPPGRPAAQLPVCPAAWLPGRCLIVPSGWPCSATPQAIAQAIRDTGVASEIMVKIATNNQDLRAHGPMRRTRISDTPEAA